MLFRSHRCLLLLVACASAYPAQLTLPAVTAPPGSSLLVPISLASQSDSVVGVQFDLQFDSARLGISPTLSSSARAAAKYLSVWQLYPGLWRFVVLGLNQTRLANGPLINLFVNVNSAAVPAAYPLQLLNIVACDPSAASVKTTATGGSVVVQGDPATAVQLQSWGVVNAASLLPGGVAPGEVVSLFGAAIGPATVLFDGIPAHVVYAGSNQINLVVPAGIQKPTTQLQLLRGSRSFAQLQIPVLDASPAIFAADGSGAGPAAILNDDYTLNSPSNPAHKGSAIMIFATGAGQINSPGVDRQISGAILPQPVLPVSVKIGGLPAQVLYAGAAPGLVSGVLQVNCIVSAKSPAGWAIPIVLTIGTYPSQPGLTLAMQ